MPATQRNPRHARSGDCPDETVRLEGDLTIATAALWQPRLGEPLARGAGLVVDLSAVSACDTIGLQLLCAAWRSAARKGLRFSICRTPESFVGACAGIGLDLPCVQPTG